MLITLKTLQEDLFTVEIEPDQTIKRFKEKIEEVKGQNYPAKYIKLMYAGKFLQDTKTIHDYNLEEKKFVIAVVKEPKKSIPEEDRELDLDDDVLLIPAHLAGDQASGNQHDHEAMVQHISELGFSREEAEHALRIGFNNPDRAVELLMSGTIRVITSRDDAAEETNASSNRMPTSEEANSSFLQHICRPDYSSTNNSILPSERRIFELFNEAAANGVGDVEEHGVPLVETLDDEVEYILGNVPEIPDGDFSDSFPPGVMSNYAPPRRADPPLPRLPEAPRPAPVSAEAPRPATVSAEAPRPVAVSAEAPRPVAVNAEAPIRRPRSRQPPIEHPISEEGVLRHLQYEQPETEFHADGYFAGDQEAIDRLRQLGFPDRIVIEAYFVCEKNENAAADYLFSNYYNY